MALGGEVTLVSVKGSRTVPVEELYKELKDGDLATEILVPVAKGQTWGYEKWAVRERFDYATISAAAALTLSGKKCTEASIALGGVTLPTRRAKRAEGMLEGKSSPTRSSNEVAKARSRGRPHGR